MDEDTKPTAKQVRDEAAEARKAVVQTASASVQELVLRLLKEGVAWSEIANVLSLAATSAAAHAKALE